MTYEDQLGGLATRIRNVEADLGKRLDDQALKALDLETAITRHMNDTFAIVNEARNEVRAFESRLRILERLVQAMGAIGDDARNTRTGGWSPATDSSQRPDPYTGGPCTSDSLVSGSSGGNINQHREEESKGESSTQESSEGS